MDAPFGPCKTRHILALVLRGEGGGAGRGGGAENSWTEREGGVGRGERGRGGGGGGGKGRRRGGEGEGEEKYQVAFDFLRQRHDGEHFSVTQTQLQIFSADGLRACLHSTMWMGT